MDLGSSAGVRLSFHSASADRMRDRDHLRAAVSAVLSDQSPAPTVTQRCPDCGGDHGQPLVGVEGVWASLSRAAGLVAVAVSTAGPVGIDLEDPAALARAPLDAFRDAELRVIRDSSDPARTATALWTAKEAILKADGRGLRCDPRDLHVDSEPLALRRWDDCPVGLEAVHLEGIAAPGGLVGTVASFAAVHPRVDLAAPPQVSLGSAFE